MTRIKICGISDEAGLLAVNRALPDFAGFIINVQKSRRNLNPLQVKELCCRLDRRITPVGVFVNAPERLPVLMLREGTIGIAQLHGSEDEDMIRRIQDASGAPVIKAFSVKDGWDLERALRSPADYILLDQGGGGSGRTFDWNLLPEIGRPWFLAGGLSEENLSEAIDRTKPYAVDLSSGVETAGKKDPAKIERTVHLVKMRRRNTCQEQDSESMGDSTSLRH